MTRMIFAAIAALAGVFFGLQAAKANEAPWCAVISKGEEQYILGLPVSLDRRMPAECAGRQSWLVQSEPVLRRSDRTSAVPQASCSPTVGPQNGLSRPAQNDD